MAFITVLGEACGRVLGSGLPRVEGREPAALRRLSHALLVACALASAVSGCRASGSGDVAALARGFQQPPASARPWTYWFWLNGNITKEGITADLEALQRVGIGGVLIMEVDQGAPEGASRLRHARVARDCSSTSARKPAGSACR